jgi:hypothetical protein
MSLTKEKKERPVSEQDKARYKIYIQVKCKYQNFIDESNFHSSIVFVMRELNKTKFFGFTKKALAIEIMTLILTDIAAPEIVARGGSELVAEIVEAIYLQGYHRKNGSCNIM